MAARSNRPDRAEHVLSLIRQMRGGALYQAEFGLRMRGEGPIAQLLSARFAAAVKRLELNRDPLPPRHDGASRARSRRAPP